MCEKCTNCSCKKNILVTRADANKMLTENWCITCGKFVEMKSIDTGLPGIFGAACPECDSHFSINILEDDADLINLPESSVLPGWVYVQGS